MPLKPSQRAASRQQIPTQHVHTTDNATRSARRSQATTTNMPFYQMVCIAAHYAEYVSRPREIGFLHVSDPPTQKHIKDLVTLAAKHVMDRGGVVRKFESWGTLALPQTMKAHKQQHQIGEYVSRPGSCRRVRLTP